MILKVADSIFPLLTDSISMNHRPLAPPTTVVCAMSTCETSEQIKMVSEDAWERGSRSVTCVRRRRTASSRLSAQICASQMWKEKRMQEARHYGIGELVSHYFSPLIPNTSWHTWRHTQKMSRCVHVFASHEPLHRAAADTMKRYLFKQKPLQLWLTFLASFFPPPLTGVTFRLCW